MYSDKASETCSQFPTRSKSDGLRCFKQPGRHLRMGLNKGRKPFGKDSSRAIRITAEELADREAKDN
ncbi:hypothetical protein KSD_70600 [Ktedonobacter sp. SOSP1-85]|nr:hypothetical protein KSD_70600 [Ktedonobacter sp. SOSP1-85]